MHRSRFRHSLSILLLILGIALPGLAFADGNTGELSVAEIRIYEDFRLWLTQQEERGEGLLERYRAVLAEEDLGEAEIERRLEIIRKQGRALEVERWNRILTAPEPRFNTEPNAYLAHRVDAWRAEGREPGTALDVGMGQGRNALYLADRGWQVTGFDPAGDAVAAARSEAERLGLTLETRVERDDEFDWGSERWDLIVLSYVSLRHLLPELQRSLKPGGWLVVEAFHHDATKGSSIGPGVVFQDNELLELFSDYRIVSYEDTIDQADFGRRQTRLVRLCAQKK